MDSINVQQQAVKCAVSYIESKGQGLITKHSAKYKSKAPCPAQHFLYFFVNQSG